MAIARDADNFFLNPQEALNLMLAQNGAIVETGTTAITAKKIFCIEFIESGAFSALTMENLSGDALTSVTLPQGFKLYGRISAFTLSSGKVIAYLYAD